MWRPSGEQTWGLAVFSANFAVSDLGDVFPRPPCVAGDPRRAASGLQRFVDACHQVTTRGIHPPSSTIYAFVQVIGLNVVVHGASLAEDGWK